MLIAVADTPILLWYTARATGIVSLVLLTCVVVLGIATAMNWRPPFLPSFVFQAVHRSVSLLSLVFIGVHVGTIVLDEFVKIDLVDAFVPFVSEYEPLKMALGTVAVDLMIALIITSLLKNRIAPQLWRLVHWAGYLCWPIAAAHGFFAGSDSDRLWVIALYVVEIAIMAALIVVRLRRPKVQTEESVAQRVLRQRVIR